MRRIRVKYLLWLAEKAGTAGEELVLNDGSLRELLELIKKVRPGLSKYMEDILNGVSELILLVNHNPPASLEVHLKDGDEVVIMPPVSGG
ncbi:MAG: MoaD family protein [Thermosphaera sp.]